jgi:hypothetical protein
VPDVDAIVLAVGSSCTLSGLVIGVALARALGLRAFQSPTFKIIGVSGATCVRVYVRRVYVAGKGKLEVL